jgi:hypothetical protein
MRQLRWNKVPGAMLAVALAMTLTTFSAEGSEVPFQEPSGSAQRAADGSQSEKSQRFAQEARRIEGVWEALVTRRVSATGEPTTAFLGMTSFFQGGSLMGTNSNPNPPTTHGRWEYLGGGRYLAVERFFRLNPDGSFAGVQRITRNITLDPDGLHLTGANTSEAFDVAGNLISRGCTTDVTNRVE